MLRYGCILMCVVAMAATAASPQAKSEASGVMLENSAIDESETNGMVENAIGRIAGMVRTLKSALEST